MYKRFMRDTRIVGLLRGNNFARAGEELYAYFPAVKKLILKNSGSRQDAEDIYQEALIILVRKVQAPDFVLSSSLNTYLYGICRYLWNDRLRQKNKVIEVEAEKVPLSFSESDVELLSREVENKLSEQAFLLLGEKCRQLLLLFYFKKKPLKDIAGLLGFSSEKVAKNQKYRCLEKAKENLQLLKASGHEEVY
jgi:RNA polymerase sigma factor (sigma-70 family)